MAFGSVNVSGGGTNNGSATSADKLTVKRKISLTGAVSGEGNFDGSSDLSIPTTLISSGVTQGGYGPEKNSSLAFDGTFPVPHIEVDATGRIIGAATYEYTLPEAPAVSSGQPVSDATTSQKGIVQLSNAINSDSENTAATSKAVKKAYDKAAAAEEAVQAGSASGSKACRTARFVVGTSTNGWTSNDCDYLCDGTDDQVEINNAVRALGSQGGEIIILAGNYRISEEITLGSNITLTGNGENATVLYRSASTSRLIYTNGTNVTVRDLGINGMSDTCSGETYGIYIYGPAKNVLLDHIRFAKNRINVFLDGNVYASNNTIRNCFFEDSGISSILDDVRITENTFYGGSRQIVSSGENSIITGNHLYNSAALSSDATTSDIIGIWARAGRNIVSGNYVYCASDMTEKWYGICAAGSHSVVTGNVVMKGGDETGEKEPDYTDGQYGIRVSGSNNLVANNVTPGKECFDNGANNTLVNNIF